MKDTRHDESGRKFKPGDSVRVARGPLVGQNGVVKDFSFNCHEPTYEVVVDKVVWLVDESELVKVDHGTTPATPTLRDTFAMSAVPALVEWLRLYDKDTMIERDGGGPFTEPVLLCDVEDEESIRDARRIARSAYLIADAMMEERGRA